MSKIDYVDETSHSSQPKMIRPKNNCAQQRKPRRRNAFISRNTIEEEENVSTTTSRKSMRRYATTEYNLGITFDSMRSLRDDVDKDEGETKHSKPFSSAVNNHRFIVLDTNGNLDTRYKGSVDFISLVNMYYIESYQFADSETHQSIIRTTILHEIKNLGYRFIEIKSLHSGKALILDDDKALQTIQDRIKEEVKSFEHSLLATIQER